MKTVFILLVVVVAALANSVQDRWNRVHQECQSNPKLFVKDSIFEQLKRGEHPTLPTNFADHASCMLINLGLQQPNGHVKQDGIREAVQRTVSSPDKVNEIVARCSVNEDTKGKTALGLFGCLSKNNINIGQL